MLLSPLLSSEKNKKENTDEILLKWNEQVLMYDDKSLHLYGVQPVLGMLLFTSESFLSLNVSRNYNGHEQT